MRSHGDRRSEVSTITVSSRMGSALPGICQKLRYARPHSASRCNPPQRCSPARLCRGCELSQGVTNLPRIDGKDGVAGSIPAGGSTPKPAGQVGSSTRPVAGPSAFDRRLPEICQLDLIALSDARSKTNSMRTDPDVGPVVSSAVSLTGPSASSTRSAASWSRPWPRGLMNNDGPSCSPIAAVHLGA
jgi:hypothetical protein